MSPPGNGQDGEGRSNADEYIFKHALTHDVSYESLLLARRRELHRRAAEAIEELYQDRLDEQAAVLGQHYAKADVPGKAVGYLTRAGDLAAKSYANEEAIAFYRQALDQIEFARARQEGADLSEHAAALHERAGDLLQLIGRHEEGRDTYGRAMALGPGLSPELTVGCKTSQARLYRKIAKTYETQRNYQETFHHYDEAETTLGDSQAFGRGEWEEWIETRLERLWVYYFLNDVEEMARQVSAIQNVVETQGTPRQRAVFSERIVLMRFQQERYVISDETIALAQRSLAFRQEAGDLLPIGHAHFRLGLAYVSCNELSAAQEQLKAAEAIGQRTGDIVLLSRCITYLLLVERRRGDTRAARRETKRLLAIASKGGMKEYVAMAKATLAWIAWREGDNAQVLNEGKEALELWSQGTAYPFQWAALWPLIAVSAGEQNAAEVIRFAKQLLEQTQQSLPQHLGDAVEEAIAEYESGREEKVLALTSRVIQLATELAYL
jgi:eukaryotic-like serine/threonine-protein kinase